MEHFDYGCKDLEMKAGCTQSDSEKLCWLCSRQSITWGLVWRALVSHKPQHPVEWLLTCPLVEIVILQNVLKALKGHVSGFLWALSLLTTSVSKAATQLQLQEILGFFDWTDTKLRGKMCSSDKYINTAHLSNSPACEGGMMVLHHTNHQLSSGSSQQSPFSSSLPFPTKKTWLCFL